ncbi:hypothetical protein BRADI_3g04261v3 [Brachypodium distachyon]|uniref:Uncharacterized protein n=1 Tax=Brachypodium distachyon TaxID=15368 RepID=A0A0Q3F1H3_BRADI|nr:hypothetical protein BRADI_3g04261v3 [Brachypodium distachyon]
MSIPKEQNISATLRQGKISGSLQLKNSPQIPAIKTKDVDVSVISHNSLRYLPEAKPQYLSNSQHQINNLMNLQM